jgi:hypothetical protein
MRRAACTAAWRAVATVDSGKIAASRKRAAAAQFCDLPTLSDTAK